MFGGLDAYGSAAIFPLAIPSLGLFALFPFGVLKPKWNKLGSVQLQLQLQRQVFPLWAVKATDEHP
jgi:hypothetical protein